MMISSIMMVGWLCDGNCDGEVSVMLKEVFME